MCFAPQAAAEESLLYVSVLTLSEIWKGLAALPQGKRRSRPERWLEVELQARFSGGILSIGPAVADRSQINMRSLSLVLCRY